MIGTVLSSCSRYRFDLHVRVHLLIESMHHIRVKKVLDYGGAMLLDGRPYLPRFSDGRDTGDLLSSHGCGDCVIVMIVVIVVIVVSVVVVMVVALDVIAENNYRENC